MATIDQHERPPQTDEVWELALQGNANFEDVCVASCERDRSKDPLKRQIAAWYYPRLLESYQEANGGIEGLFVGRNVWAGVALTKNGGLDRTGLSAEFADDLLVEPLLGHCDEFASRVMELFPPGLVRTLLMNSVFGLATYFLSALDNEEGRLNGTHEKDERASLVPTERYIRELNLYALDILHLKAAIDAAAQKQCRYVYLRGVAIGTPILALATCLTALSFIWAPNNWEIPAVVLAGGAGGVLSVLTRLTTLHVDPEIGRWHQRIAGATRPLVGAVFGLFLYLALKGGALVPLKKPEPAQAIYFYSALAFVMGFSERLAKDVVTRVGAPLRGPAAEALPAGAAAPLPAPPVVAPPPFAPQAETQTTGLRLASRLFEFVKERL